LRQKHAQTPARLARIDPQLLVSAEAWQRAGAGGSGGDTSYTDSIIPQFAIELPGFATLVLQPPFFAT